MWTSPDLFTYGLENESFSVLNGLFERTSGDFGVPVYVTYKDLGFNNGAMLQNVLNQLAANNLLVVQNFNNEGVILTLTTSGWMFKTTARKINTNREWAF